MRVELVLAACLLAGAAGCGTVSAQAQRAEDGMAASRQRDIALQGEGPWQRFIVKYRGDSAPGRDAGAVQARLDRAAAGAGLAAAAGGPPALRWERRLGVRADLVIADPPLQRPQAERLLRELAADADVEYVEPDAMMRHWPTPAAPPPDVEGD